jgi:hypothetical protein
MDTFKMEGEAAMITEESVAWFYEKKVGSA